MNRWLGSFVLFFPFLTGCHVIERARQCKQLVKLVEEAAPEIRNTAVGENPDANSLRKKARLYGQLGAKMESVSFHLAELQKETSALTSSLKTVEKHLNEAADAVDNDAEHRKHSHAPVVTADNTSPAAPAPSAAPTPAPPGRQTLAPAPRIPTLARSTMYSRRYLQAKRAAETAGRAMTSSAQRLTKACR